MFDLGDTPVVPRMNRSRRLVIELSLLVLQPIFLKHKSMLKKDLSFEGLCIKRGLRIERQRDKAHVVQWYLHGSKVTANAIHLSLNHGKICQKWIIAVITPQANVRCEPSLLKWNGFRNRVTEAFAPDACHNIIARLSYPSPQSLQSQQEQRLGE